LSAENKFQILVDFKKNIRFIKMAGFMVLNWIWKNILQKLEHTSGRNNMDKSILEFWGRVLLNAASSQKQWEEMNKNIEKMAVENPFMKLFLTSFGWSSPKKEKEEDIIVEFTEKSTAVQKELIKAFLTMFDVVPKEKYLSVVQENEELRIKITQLENIIQSYKKMTENESYHPEKVMDNLTQIMNNQTQQFKELMKQLNAPLKKTTNGKKK